MPEGALLTHTVEAVLHDLAGSAATGCLVVRDQEGDEAEVYLRGGEVYAVSVPGRRVMLGVRLMSRGALTPEALAEALEIQRTELQGWRLGELLVHLGYVELTVVEEFVVEHLKDALTDLLGWPVAAWKFRKNKKTRQDVAPPTPVAALFDDLRHRATTWETILAATGGPDAVPTLAASSPSDDVALGPNEWALLCKVDGHRPVTELATECGFTLFEAGQVVMRLVEAGLVAVLGHESGAPVPAAAAEVEVPGEMPDEALEPIVESQVEVAESQVEVAEVEPADAGVELLLPVVALRELEARESEERAAAEDERQAAREREERRVAAENKRLQEAEILHRELEALAAKEAAARAERAEARRRTRAEEQTRTEAALSRARAADEQKAQRQQDDGERLAAEVAAWAEHDQWLAAQRTAAEATAWADHTAWLAAQRTAAEDSAWGEHHQWLAAQRASTEAAAWADHDQWLAARAAEDAQRAAEEAQRAVEEAERAEAERRAARLQAERELAAEAERRARDAAEAEVRREAERIARDEAARQERAEADRLAAEAAEQIAAAEAERIAVEQAEAEQIAAEAERAAAERAAAEQAEAERLAGEQAEAQRAAAAEAQRIAAERAEAQRRATEQAEAERLAQAARVPAPGRAPEDSAHYAAHAASMLTELNRDAPVGPPVQAAEPAPQPEPAPVAQAAPDTGPTPMVARDHADTAMLLRELSSLGFSAEDGPTSPPGPSRPAHPVSTSDPKKKRKGLFGRG